MRRGTYTHQRVRILVQIGDPENCRMENQRFTKVPIIHYTHGLALGEDGGTAPMEGAVWSWNKRSYMAHYPTVPFDPPPENGPETIMQLISQINEAAASPEFADWWRANTDLSKE